MGDASEEDAGRGTEVARKPWEMLPQRLRDAVLSGVTRGRWPMKRTWMTLLAAAMVTSTLTLAAPAAADPPATTIEEGIEIFCEFEYGDLQGEVFAVPEYAFFELFSGGGQLAYYGGGPDISMDDTSLSVEWTLRDLSDTVVGSATIAATYGPVGDPITTDERYRDGNRWVEEHRVSTELAGSGTVTILIDDQTSEVPTECGGEAFTTEIWSTNPSAHVTRDSGAYFFCELESDGWDCLRGGRSVRGRLGADRLPGSAGVESGDGS